MRITNSMMINNTLNNINNNKITKDKLNTQLATERKIQKPSEDPIIAIRALRLRSTLNEIDQYLNRNIPDADAWLSLTEDALVNVKKVVSDIIEYCEQASSDTNDVANRSAILEALKAYKDQIYQDANADYAGRTLFTGYRTDQKLTFDTDEVNTTYNITEKFTVNDFEIIKKISNAVDITNIAKINVTDMPTDVSVNRIRLSYDSLDAGTMVLKDGLGSTVAYTEVLSTDAGAYEPGDNGVYFIRDTGELVFGNTAMNDVILAGGINASYDKTGFDKGELRPEHYFDCTNIAKGITYTAEDQPIEYAVNFNQRLKVNTEGKDVFTHDMARNIDEMTDSVSRVSEIQTKIDSITSMLANPIYESDADQEKLHSMLEAANREYDYAEDIMQKTFAHGISQFQKSLEDISLSIADIGARGIRLELNKDRLESQQISVKDLKSLNEEINITEVAVKFASAESVYDASLAAAAKIVSNKLINFL